MKIQKQVSDKRGDKVYSKYVIVLPKDTIEKAGFEEGQELEVNAEKGRIVLRKGKN